MSALQNLRLLWNRVLSGSYRWFPNRYLAVVGDGAGWALDYEASQVARIMRLSGQRTIETVRPLSNQVAFIASRDAALHRMDRWRRMGVSVCFPYYHGYPGEGEAHFDETFDLLRRHHAHVARIQVTHPRMRTLLLETGIAPDKVRSIVIGIDSRAFSAASPDERIAVRRRLGIPQSALVVGSFQKDGNGWGEGLEPKLMKGPDVLLKAMTLLKQSVPELFVLLSGPARGFVKKGLDSAGIPYVHTTAATYSEIPPLFHALDAYMVASRQEGGPKAILESMAAGVPIVSTRVGQAPELIRHGENGWLVDVGDAEGLAHFTGQALAATGWRATHRDLARKTAEANDYLAQTPQWTAFFDGLLAPSALEVS